ncbi:sensor domain-containing phosphodiesterase [Mycolicibacterium rhodesiae]|uniref:EAL domain-containing protein n=1 Tax=Mycolicibacterium rhodesiae TaxID=36814 RepID=A0A1X0J092_MYCRH|nr:EAL domain-containing protein [Mycolicibacterium rhodesiae]MCV7345347.1 EAL domain-containing protein [Mycolicibacterium rhodesiae]ORB54962.1 hypothetical protein BST42_09290 [Mycolicibacterium rhodesiae]
MIGEKDMARALAEALRADAVEPYFQPIVALDDGRILGLEVLARWEHPEWGRVSPARFIPVADRFGLLDQLLDTLLRRAFAAAQQWPPSIFLGFNVSPAQLHDPDLPRRIAAAAQDLSFPLGRVHIEVTEAGVIHDLAQSKRTLEQLVNLGCMIAMDDFGTGYSSLTWLSALPFSKLKIDTSFVTAMTEHRQSRKIVAAVISLGHSLGLAVVAEGVENSSQADMLREMGGRLAQGYLFGRPTSAEQVLQLWGEDAAPRTASASASLALELERVAREHRDLTNPDAPATAFMDVAGSVVACNRAFEQLLAVDSAARAAIGHHIWELMAITPEAFAEVRATDLLGQPFPAIETTTPAGSPAGALLRSVRDDTGELLGYQLTVDDSPGRLTPDTLGSP